MTNRQLLKMLDVIFYNQGKALNFCLARSAGDITARLRSALSAVLLLVLHVYQSPAFENVSYRFFITNIKFPAYARSAGDITARLRSALSAVL